MKMWSTVVAPLLLLLLAKAEGQRRPRPQDTQLAAAPQQQQIVSQCPLPNGFFADAQQCDKYYQCVDNVITEKLCPDGLAFVDHNPRSEKCDYISAVDCTGRPELQPAQPAGACLRQNGYFFHPDETVCNQFFFCAEGTGNLVTCPTGLVFSGKSNNCVWADEAGRAGCSTPGGGPAFECPKVTHDVAVAHPRYADPDDCQYFYVCIDGVNPRRNGCTFGQVFNSALGTCTSPAETPECGNYYTEYFDDYFKTLNTGGRPRGDILAAAFEAGYKIPSHALGKIDRSQSPGVAATFAAAAPAPAPAAAPPRQIPTRRRRPTAAAPAPAAVPVLTGDDSFTLTTGLGAAAQAVPAGPPALAAAPAPTGTRRRRPLVSVRRAQRSETAGQV
ncbi:protein obstructor-E-like [Scylla paramamosain]|uniref:protein obstructor-E-like n=1 Tax=Scylla paramamosain TaxID=85552 RepID=UPI0030830A4A